MARETKVAPPPPTLRCGLCGLPMPASALRVMWVGKKPVNVCVPCDPDMRRG